MMYFILSAQQTDMFTQSAGKVSAAVKKVQALQNRSLDISASDLDSSGKIARLSLKLAAGFKNDTCFSFAYMATGWYYYYKGNKDSAEYYLLEAANIARRISMPLLEGRCLLNLSYVYQDGNEFVKLLDCLKRARPLVEKDNDETILAGLDLVMGSTYGDMQLYEQGKKYIFSAIAINKKFNQAEYLSSCYSALGYLLMQQENFDSALYYYHLGYAFSIQMKDLESAGVTADNLGEAFEKKGERFSCSYCIDSAYHYYNTGLHWFTEMKSLGNVEYSKMNIGSVLITKKEYGKAEKYLIESFGYFDSVNDVKYAYNCSQLLSKLYENTGNYKQAYDYHQITLKYKESLDAKNRTDSIAKMFALYETEKRDRTIQLLNTKAKLDKEEIARQQLVLWFAIISIAFAVVLLIVTVNRYRIKQQLKEVKVRNQLAADLHDEVGSSLSSILLLSKMAAKENAPDGNKTMLEKISGNTKEVIDKMGDIVWMMNPKYDEGGNMREKLEQYISRMRDVAVFKIHLEIDAAFDSIKFPMETRKAIFLIIKEAVNNSLKYAEASNVFIKLMPAEKNMLLVITDDGKGFTITETVAGNGLGTMALRAKDVKGNFELVSAEGKGTEIKITIPIPHFRQKIV